MARTGPRKPHTPPSVVTGLKEAEALLEHKSLPEARQLLEDLDRQFPDRLDVLSWLAHVCHQMRDLPALLTIAERLVRLKPHDPDFMYSLAGAYLQARLLILALLAFRRCLAEHPAHRGALSGREHAALLEDFLQKELAATGLPAEAGLEALKLTDELRSLGMQSRLQEAQAVAAELLARFPRFVLGLNSIVQLYLTTGELEQALGITGRVLAIEPDSIHALARRVRILCLLGRLDQARAVGERLGALAPDHDDAELKRAEALSYLGDDQGVLLAFQRAEAAGQLPLLQAAGLLYHLAAVAELRLGHEAEAAALWNEALRRMPDLEVARQNLADRCKPVGEQHAPWAFCTEDWVSRGVTEDLHQALQGPTDREAAQAAVRRFLTQHPEMVSLAPLLLDRGDPETRKLVVSLGWLGKTEELLRVLADFAQGTRGPDLLRLRAAKLAAAAGLLPGGPQRLWIEGAWQLVQPLHFELDPKPAVSFGPQVTPLLIQADQAIRDGQLTQAELLVRQALEREPDSAALLNHLAAILSEQRRNREAEALVDSIHQRFPTDVIGITHTARRHLRHGELDQARALLAPLLERERFGLTDFANLCAAQIELLVSSGDRTAARLWLQMWDEAIPQHPDLGAYRRRIERP